MESDVTERAIIDGNSFVSGWKCDSVSSIIAQLPTPRPVPDLCHHILNTCRLYKLSPGRTVHCLCWPRTLIKALRDSDCVCLFTRGGPISGLALYQHVCLYHSRSLCIWRRPGRSPSPNSVLVATGLLNKIIYAKLLLPLISTAASKYSQINCN